MQANLPSSNYDTDKQKKDKDSKRASALKSNDGLHKINEENEYEDQLSQRPSQREEPSNLKHQGASRGTEVPLPTENRRNRQRPRIRNDVFQSKDRLSVDQANDYKPMEIGSDDQLQIVPSSQKNSGS